MSNPTFSRAILNSDNDTVSVLQRLIVLFLELVPVCSSAGRFIGRAAVGTCLSVSTFRTIWCSQPLHWRLPPRSGSDSIFVLHISSIVAGKILEIPELEWCHRTSCFSFFGRFSSFFQFTYPRKVLFFLQELSIFPSIYTYVWSCLSTPTLDLTVASPLLSSPPNSMLLGLRPGALLAATAYTFQVKSFVSFYVDLESFFRCRSFSTMFWWHRRLRTLQWILYQQAAGQLLFFFSCLFLKSFCFFAAVQFRRSVA